MLQRMHILGVGVVQGFGVWMIGKVSGLGTGMGDIPLFIDLLGNFIPVRIFYLVD